MNPTRLEALFPGTCKAITAYRMVNEEFASTIDEIGHAIRWGWRYNPQGEFGALYLSLSATCCLKEKLKQTGGRESLRPQVLGTFELSIAHCLDLTDETVCATLETTVQRLTTPYDFTEPQAIAREARRVGFEAMIVPSAVSAECTNLIVFKDKLGRGSFCELKEVRQWEASSRLQK